MEIDYIPGKILAIFWTTSSFTETDNRKAIQITNKNKNILEAVQSFLSLYGFDYSIYRGKPENKRTNYTYNYYRMKIYNNYIISLLRNYYNWRGRKEEKRYYPTIDFEDQEIGFLKYYVKNKGSLDYVNVGWKDEKVKRYRVWGNWNYIDYLNKRISYFLDINENKPQKHKNSDLMMTLYYQSQNDVDKILDFIGRN